MNRALHAMSAHLYRYGSELSSVEDTIVDILLRLKSILGAAENDTSPVAKIELSLEEAKGQLKAAETLRLELERKIQNILALVGYGRCSQSFDR